MNKTIIIQLDDTERTEEEIKLAVDTMVTVDDMGEYSAAIVDGKGLLQMAKHYRAIVEAHRNEVDISELLDVIQNGSEEE